MNVGDTYKVNIDSFDVNGYGVCHLDKKVVFVQGAMEGEELIIEITSIHKNYLFAKIKRILKKSNDRIESLCPYYKYCGGCDMLHMSYDCELKIKENSVRQTLRKLDYKLNPIVKSDNIYGYRNKIMIPFKRDLEDDVIYGFYEKMSHDVISIDKCIISNDISNEIVALISRYLSLFHISIYDENTNKGIFREVMVRNTSKDEYMVVLVVTQKYDFSGLIELLTKEYKQIKSIYLNINDKKTNVILTNNYELLYGSEVIIENILNLDFNVSFNSFMQINHNQCEKLYDIAISKANLDKSMNVIDAYCGMGSITLNIAKRVNHVYGIEVVDEAIINANNNKILNNISNAAFICGKCEDEIKKLVNLEKIDCIFFDPPRKGCDIDFLDTVIKMKIPKIVYISCNIATANRDIEILEKNGYKLLDVTPVDMFPRTMHVETICVLTKK